MSTPAGCPVHAQFDPLSDEYLEDPYAVLAELPIAEAPVFYAPSIDYYVVTRYADIEQVYRDPDTYSAAVAQAPLAPLVAEAQQILLGSSCPREPRYFSGWPRPTAIRSSSPTPTGSTCTGPTATTISRSAAACTTAWAPTSGVSRLG